MTDDTLVRLLDNATSKRHQSVVVSVARDAGFDESEIKAALQEITTYD